VNMRLQLLSDLHFEFHRDHGRSFVSSLDPSGVDILVVAGDLEVGDGLPRALALLCERYRESLVAFVLGNHEFYGSSPAETCEMVRKAAHENPNLIWLDCSSIQETGSGRKRVLGATLWFPHYDSNPRAKACLTDFSAIEGFEPWVYEQNRRAVEYLAREIRPGDIVVTHHLPSPVCVAPQYVGSILNPFFVCDMTDVILDREPSLWLFGHTHSSMRTQIGKTRMLCNPFGYLGSMDVNMHFDKHFVIEA
jgi:predicted phosphodiesterase